jgi:hypothetical protein
MDEDREHAEQLTEEERALRRRARFGELPAGVEPGDLIETRETRPPHEERPEPLIPRYGWGT